MTVHLLKRSRSCRGNCPLQTNTLSGSLSEGANGVAFKLKSIPNIARHDTNNTRATTCTGERGVTRCLRQTSANTFECLRVLPARRHQTQPSRVEPPTLLQLRGSMTQLSERSEATAMRRHTRERAAKPKVEIQTKARNFCVTSQLRTSLRPARLSLFSAITLQ